MGTRESFSPKKRPRSLDRAEREALRIRDAEGKIDWSKVRRQATDVEPRKTPEAEPEIDLDALVAEYERATKAGMSKEECTQEANRLLELLKEKREELKAGKATPEQLQDLVYVATLEDRIEKAYPYEPDAESNRSPEPVPQAAQQMQATPEEPRASVPGARNEVETINTADVEARIAESGVKVPEIPETPQEPIEPSVPQSAQAPGERANKVEEFSTAQVEARIAAGSETPIGEMTPSEQKDLLKRLVNADEFVKGMQEFADADSGMRTGFEPGFKDKSKMAEAVLSVATEKAAMQEAENAYLAAYKDFYTTSGAFSRARQSVFGGVESKEIEQLKSAYDAKRVEYARALEQSVEKRLTTRGADPERQARVLERYNRLVRFNEVVRPAAEKRIAARAEALDAKGKSVFGKTLNWFVMSNLKLDKRYGTYGARAIRAGAAAVAVAGGSALLGTGAALGVAGLAGAGSVRFLQSFIAGSVAAGGAQFFGNLYRDTRGRDVMERSQQQLKSEGRGSKESLTLDELARVDQARGTLIRNADERTLAKKTAGVKFLVGLGLGVELATAAADILAASPESAVTEPTIPQEAAAGAARPSTVPPPAETIIAGPGDGGIKLFARLQESVRADYPNGSDNPSIQHLLDSSPDALAKEYGFYKLGAVAESALVEKGSVLGFMPDGTLTYQAGEDGAVETLSPGRSFDSYLDTDARSSIQPESAEPSAANVSEPIAPGSEPVTSEAPNPPPPPVEMPDNVPANVPETASETSSEAARAPITENLRINAHGAEIDPDHAGLFQDETGARKILHGGTLEERMALAQKVIEKDHSAVVYFDSSKTGFLGLRTFHLTRGVWDPETGTVLLRDETTDPSLRGMRLPTEADLYPLTSEKK